MSDRAKASLRVLARIALAIDGDLVNASRILAFFDSQCQEPLVFDDPSQDLSIADLVDTYMRQAEAVADSFRRLLLAMNYDIAEEAAATVAGLSTGSKQQNMISPARLCEPSSIRSCGCLLRNQLQSRKVQQAVDALRSLAALTKNEVAEETYDAVREMAPVVDQACMQCVMWCEEASKSRNRSVTLAAKDLPTVERSGSDSLPRVSSSNNTAAMVNGFGLPRPTSVPVDLAEVGWDIFFRQRTSR
jgi:hypothetical protein